MGCYKYGYPSGDSPRTHLVLDLVRVSPAGKKLSTYPVPSGWIPGTVPELSSLAKSIPHEKEEPEKKLP
jgi:hypothetical protein